MHSCCVRSYNRMSCGSSKYSFWCIIYCVLLSCGIEIVLKVYQQRGVSNMESILPILCCSLPRKPTSVSVSAWLQALTFMATSFSIVLAKDWHSLQRDLAPRESKGAHMHSVNDARDQTYVFRLHFPETHIVM